MKLILKLVLALAVTSAAILFIPAKISEAPVAESDEPPLQTPPTPEALLKIKLRNVAEAKGLPENKVAEIEKTIGGVPGTKCPNGESTWNPNAIGDGGDSHGLVQIHLPSHPEITKEQAHDEDFAINFIVDRFLEGKENLWTCWKATTII